MDSPFEKSPGRLSHHQAGGQDAGASWHALAALHRARTPAMRMPDPILDDTTRHDIRSALGVPARSAWQLG